MKAIIVGLTLALLCFATVAQANNLMLMRKKAVQAEKLYGCMVQSAADEFGYPQYGSRFVAQMLAESTIDPDAVSVSGAIGLMQIKPEAALAQVRKIYGHELFSDDLRNPKNSIRVGIAYMAYLMDVYDQGLSYGHIADASAAYNEGPTGMKGKRAAQEWEVAGSWDHRYNEKIRDWWRYVPSPICM